VRRTGPTNILLRKTIRMARTVARRYNAPVWRYVAELLERSARRRVVVNLSKIDRYVAQGEVAVVPGKVLGAGNLSRPVTVVAFSFSRGALNKIKAVGGRAITILDYLNQNPKGSRIRVII